MLAVSDRFWAEGVSFSARKSGFGVAVAGVALRRDNEEDGFVILLLGRRCAAIDDVPAEDEA
jgi:hypothetical protein